MKNILHLDFETYIYEVQHEFNEAFPFLRLHFYRMVGMDPKKEMERKIITRIAKLRAAGLKRAGEIECDENMSVMELEQRLYKDFGLIAQVVRQSGIIWLETTMTDSWSLKQQNLHGMEITQTVVQTPGSAEDFDLGRGNL